MEKRNILNKSLFRKQDKIGQCGEIMISELIKLITRALFFGGYLSGESSYPKPLTKKEETECFKRMKNGDKQARDKLIRHNMRLVAHIAKKFAASGDMDDLISIGSIGLIKGIESYNSEKCTTLATFLARCIENEILMTLRSAKRHNNTVYISDTLGIDSDGNEYSLMDILSVKEESVFRQVEQNVLAEKLNELLLESLTEREYAVMRYRYGLKGTPVLTQLQTAEKLHISRSYVSRIESKSLGKLREVLIKEHFDE